MYQKIAFHFEKRDLFFVRFWQTVLVIFCGALSILTTD